MDDELRRETLVVVNEGVLAYFVLVNLAQSTLLVCGWLEAREGLTMARGRRWLAQSTNLLPHVSVLVPAHNEGLTIVEMVTATLAVHHSRLEVVVVNDGSTDDTMEKLIREFALEPFLRPDALRIATRPVREVYGSRQYPGLIVVDKENGGKADALNAGLGRAVGDLICAVDADTVLEPDALVRLALPLAQDERVIAAGGVIRVVNGCRVRFGRVVERLSPQGLLGRFQEVEYARAFLFGRLGWNRLGDNVIISGAFGVFRRDAVVAAGGYRESTVGEDMELVLRLRRLAYEAKQAHRVVFVPDPIAWTEVPSTLRTLGRQRSRWHRGLAEVIRMHWRVIGRPRYGLMGLVVMPYYLMVELLAPVVEALGLVFLGVALYLHALELPFALLLALAAYGFALILGMMALTMEEWFDGHNSRLRDRTARILITLLEQLGYRQLTVWWRLRGLVQFARGKTTWGEQTRLGSLVTGPSRSTPSWARTGTGPADPRTPGTNNTGANR
jgi:cellulose synthase/poly-beta-1,6-N-acetylglucosamine synthase-like glycosyltransferase